MTDSSYPASSPPTALAHEVEAALERAVFLSLSMLAGAGFGSRDAQPESRVFVDYHRAHAMTGLSRTTIIRGVKDGTFPQPIKFGRRTLFKRDEVQNWIEARLSERSRSA